MPPLTTPLTDPPLTIWSRRIAAAAVLLAAALITVLPASAQEQQQPTLTLRVLPPETASVSEGETAQVPVCIEVVGQPEGIEFPVRIDLDVVTEQLSRFHLDAPADDGSGRAFASTGNDYIENIEPSLTFELRMPTARPCQNFQVRTIEDRTEEADELFLILVSINNAFGRTVILLGKRLIYTILDDDEPVVFAIQGVESGAFDDTIVPPFEEGDEEDIGFRKICVAVVSHPGGYPREGGATLFISLSDYSAVSPDDYVLSDSSERVLVFQQNDRVVCARFILDVVNDAIYEGDEDLLISLSLAAGSPAALRVSTPDARLRILDNEEGPGINLFDTAAAGRRTETLTVDEGGTVEYFVALNSQPSEDVELQVLFYGIPADGGLVVGDGSAVIANAAAVTEPLTFTPGNWDVRQAVTVRLNDNDYFGPNPEMVIVYDASNYGYGATSMTLTIGDNEPAPVFLPLLLTIPGSSASGEAHVNNLRIDDDRGRFDLEIVATLSGPLAEPLELALSFGPCDANGACNAEAPVNPYDYFVVPASPRLSIPALRLSGTATVELTVIDDGIVKGSSDFFILAEASGGVPGQGKAQARVTIDYNDDQGFVFSREELQVAEGGPGVSYGLALASRPTDSLTVVLQVEAATAANGVRNNDIRLATAAEPTAAATSLTLRFTQSNWNRPRILVVSAAEDDDARSGRARIVHSLEGLALADGIVGVTDRENDSPGVLFYASGTLEIGGLGQVTGERIPLFPTTTVWVTEPEPGEMERFHLFMALASQPAAEVEAILHSPITGEGIQILGGTGGIHSFSMVQWQSGMVTIFLFSDLDAFDNIFDFYYRTDSTDPDYHRLAPASVPVLGNYVRAFSMEERDRDRRGLSFSSGGRRILPTATLRVAEGGAVSYDLRLDSQPFLFGRREELSLMLVVRGDDRDADVADILLSPQRLLFSEVTFRPDFYSKPHRLTLTAPEDADALSEEVIIGYRFVNTDYHGFMLGSTTLIIEDNDQPSDAVILSLSAEPGLAVPEGGTLTLGVVARLNDAARLEDTVVRLSFAGGSAMAGQDYRVLDIGALTIAAGSLTVSLQLELDILRDGLIEEQESFLFRAETDSGLLLKFAEAEEGQRLIEREIAILSSDEIGLRVSGTAPGEGLLPEVLLRPHAGIPPFEFEIEGGALRLREGVEDDVITLTMRLGSRPTDTVNVNTFRNGIVPEGPPDRLETSPVLPLRFKPENWDIAQVLAIRVPDDDIDRGTRNYLLGLDVISAGAGNYNFANCCFSLQLEDDDEAGVLIVGPDEGNRLLLESPSGDPLAGSAATSYRVALSSQPMSTVRVSLLIAEGQGAVRLDRVDGSNRILTAGVAALEFAPGRWNQTQTVQVQALDNNHYSGTRVVRIEHSLSSEDGSYAALSGLPSVELSVADDEGPPQRLVVTLSRDGSEYTDSIELREDDGEVQLGVRAELDVAYFGVFRVTLDGRGLSENHGAASAGVDFSVPPLELDFLPGEAVTEALVLLSVVDDDYAEETEALSFLAGASSFSIAEVRTPVVTIIDDDQRGLVIEPEPEPGRPQRLREGGSYEYRVNLSSRPTGDVGIALEFDGALAGRVSVSPSSLTFSEDGWSATEGRVVTVTALDDSDPDNHELEIRHSVAAPAGGYSVESAVLALRIEDDDRPSTRVDIILRGLPDNLQLGEAGGVVEWTVEARLNGAVTDTAVVIDLELQQGSATGGEDYSFVPALPQRLTIEAGAAMRLLTLTLSLTDDEVAGGDEDFSLVYSTASGLQLSPLSHSISILDDDERGLWIDGVYPGAVAARSVSEGERVSFTVRLNSEPHPGEQVSVGIAVPEGAGELLVSPALIFDADNWMSPRELSIGASDNSVAEGNRNYRLLLEAGSNQGGAHRYGSEQNLGFGLTVVDDDEAGILISAAGQRTVPENASTTYEVVLTSRPTAEVTVTLAVTAGRQAIRLDRVSGRNGLLRENVPFLSFAEDDWNQTQTVRVNAIGNDYYSGTRVVRIDHRVSSEFPDGGDPVYHLLHERQPLEPVVLSVLDDEEPPQHYRLTLSRDGAEYTSTLEVGEGEGRVRLSIRAELDVPYFEAVVVELVIAGEGTDALAEAGVDYLLEPPTLLIPAGQAAVETAVELQLLQDRIAEGTEHLQVGAINVIAQTPLSADAEAPVLSLGILDDDERGLLFAPALLRVLEGRGSEYSVRLASSPTLTVNLEIAVVTPDGYPGSLENAGLSFSVAGEQSDRLMFTTENWHRPQTVIVSAAEDTGANGPRVLQLVHRATGGDYDGESGTLSLELSDTDARLSSLEVALDGGRMATLRPVFDANVLEYGADIPFGTDRAFIRAVPTATGDIVVDGVKVQNRAEVRIFHVTGSGAPEALEDGDNVAGQQVVVDRQRLRRDGVDFEFRIQVSVDPLEGSNDETVFETYTLRLRRALPAAAALLVFPAADAERQRPLTLDAPLNFGPDVDEMDLIFVVRDEDGNSYSISELEAAGPGLGARVRVDTGSQTEPEEGAFETPVTLRRDQALTAGTFTFNLTFTATPQRPLAVGAEQLTVGVAGTLYDNSDTATGIRASYRGHDQEQALPVSQGDLIRVSSNGTLTIDLGVERRSGGLRDFEQASFTLSVTPADSDRVNLTDDRLEIQSGDNIGVTVDATGGATLGDRINDPVPLQFNVSFVRPTAEIRPAASADALFDFDSNLFFAFVNEDNGEDNDNDNDNRLPLEVALTGDSTPLADSGRILGGISLTLTVVGEGAGNAIRIGGPAGSAAPGRDLLFEVMAPRANVGVTVGLANDASAERTALVDVASLDFTAHLLSFIYDDEIGINSDEEQPVVISRVMLKGAGSAESWTLSVGNPLELDDGGYEVEEVVVVERATRVSRIVGRVVMPAEPGSTTLITTYSSRTVTVRLLDGDGPDTTVATAFEDVAEADVPVDALAQFAADDSLRTATVVTEIPATYRPATGEERQAATVTRTLRITSTSDDPRNSRILLGVDYRPGVVDEGAAGRFSRIIALLTGEEPVLNAEVRGDNDETVEDIVLPRGGSTELTLVISNLLETDDPNVRGAITYRFDQTDLRVAPLEAAEIDRNNRRSEQRLTVEVSESADRAGYPVSIDVRLGGRSARAEFRIDINDAPEYVGETRLTVKEDGDAAAGGIQAYVLTVHDPDGGLMELSPDDLMLEAVLGDNNSEPFTFGTGVQELVPYFSLASGSVERRDLAGGANELFVTLTLTGRLATPFGSVVELRLSGATDGYDVLNQRLLVQVEDVAPTFMLATTTVTVFADQREVVLKLDEFSDGRRGATPGDQLPVVVVQHAPDDLVVRFDREQRQVTLIRLNDSQDDEDEQITLVVVDSQGGRTEVTLNIERPSLLPQILPPSPLLVVAGDDNPVVRELSFTEATDLEVIWTASGHEDLNAVVETLDDGSGRVAVSALLAVAGRAFMLELTATSADGMQRTAELPVVVVAPAPRPRLQLSLKAADPADPTTAGSTVSSFLLTDTLFVEATLAGQLPQQIEVGSVTTFTLSIARLGPDGEPIATATVEWELTTTVEVNADLRVGLALMTASATGLQGLDVADGQVVEISISHFFGSGVIEGDRLRLPVVDLRDSAEPLDAFIDTDNDGLVDAAGDEVDPAILGPIEAAVAAVTDAGVEVQDDELSLSLGNLARSLNLGQCGGVTLALMVAMDGTVAGLSGCGDALLTDFENLDTAEAVTQALSAGGFGGGAGDYLIVDLSIRFDSSETEANELVLINLPPHPGEHLSYEVYRLVEATWVPVIDAGLPGGAGGAGALEGVADCDTCFYGVDDDRDGSVELLLLLRSVEEPLNLEVGEEFRDRRLELDAGADGTVIPLSGLRPGLTPVVTGSDNVEGEFSNTVAAGPALILTGSKRTLGGPEEVLVELFDDDGGAAVASFTLQVGVRNQPPVITFELDGEETTTISLEPNTETVVRVIITDPDGDDSFRLELAKPGDDEIARLVSRAMPSADSSAVFVVEHRLVLTPGAARSPFRLRVRATDLTDPDDDGGTLSERLTVCVLNEDGKCPAASRSSGGGGGGGGSGLLWLFLAAPAALVRLRRRQRLAF